MCHLLNFDTQSNESDYYKNESFEPFFRQKDYYCLFDQELKFSKRKGFCIDQDLDVIDYLKMISVNRKNLTKFFKRINRNRMAGDD